MNNWIELFLTGVLIGIAIAVPCSLVAMVIMARERDRRAAQPARTLQQVETDPIWHSFWSNEPREIDSTRPPVVIGGSQGDSSDLYEFDYD